MIQKTEREKMLAGEVYNCLDADLIAVRLGTKELLRRFNQAESEPERREVLLQLIGGIGHQSLIEPPFYCSYGHNTYLGDHVYINFQCTILDNNQVRIGNYVMLGPAVQVYTAAHLLEPEGRRQGLEEAKPIVIEDNVWIGGAAILLPGVRVGRNAVVGAGSVVTRDVAANTVVAGNPARVIRRLEE